MDMASRSSITPKWTYYARRGSDSKAVKISGQQAAALMRSPGGTRDDFLLLWLVPPMYQREAKWRVERGYIPPAWEYNLGAIRQEEDFRHIPDENALRSRSPRRY